MINMYRYSPSFSFESFHSHLDECSPIARRNRFSYNASDYLIFIEPKKRSRTDPGKK